MLEMLSLRSWGHWAKPADLPDPADKREIYGPSLPMWNYRRSSWLDRG